MKSNVALRVVENNSFASKDFTIQASGKMFHMVISGLYSNKPQSITREIWSNAFDAHAMVGKHDVPFEVTFPTALAPTFSCRDFGPGIAHEDMEGFYTVLGHSTKEDTNTAVGKWGVGRMSPMSYTDTFSVTSRHKGMVSYYAVQLGPDGSPQLHVLAPPTPTDEPDGLEVSFPVKQKDIHNFQRAAELVSYGFDVPPTITNSQEKAFTPIKKIFEDKSYYLYEDSRMSGPYAQMGCVLYPIPRESVDVPYKDIVYKFEIGDLEVTASREALSFGPNDPTAANIKKVVEEAENKLRDRLQKELDAQPKEFFAAKLAPKFHRYVRNGSFTYRGTMLTRYWDLSKYKELLLYCGHKSGRKTVGWGLDSKVDVTYDYKIFVQDTSDKKGNVRAGTRIAAALSMYDRYIWVRADLSQATVKAELKQLIDDLDYPVSYVKDLPDTGAKSSVRGPRTKVTVSRFANQSFVQLEKFTLTDQEFAEGGYCYFMSNNNAGTVLLSGNKLIKAVHEKEIVLVPKTLWKKFKANSKWKDAEVELKSLVDKHLETSLKKLSCNYKAPKMLNLRKLEGVGGIVGDFIKKVNEPHEHFSLGLDVGGWGALGSHYSKNIRYENPAEKEYGEILQKYPLIVFASNYGFSEVDAMKDYIKLIDNANKE